MTGSVTRHTPRREKAIPFPGGAGILQRVFTRLGCPGRPPHFVSEFYPYASLMHTIRLREDVAFVRFSDLLRAAPLAAQEATAAMLLSRLYRRRLPRALLQAYQRFSLAHGTRRRAMRLRGRRGRRVKSGPQGRHHDLAPLFSKLNAEYFGARLARPHMGWSTRPWGTQLGCFDPALNQIVLSCRLDQENVPAYVVEYVLFHEMLHVKHPVRRASCGLQAHSAHFRKEEKQFADYQRARRFLERLR